MIDKTRRRGSISPLFPTMIALFCAAAALAIEAASVGLSKERLQGEADAAALAAAGALLSDDLFAGDPDTMVTLAEEARRAAERFSEVNGLSGGSSRSEVRQVVFGILEQSGSRNFEVVDLATSADDPSRLLVNTARVVATTDRSAGMFLPALGGYRAPRISTGATAMLDRDLIGVRPVGRGFAPLMPLVLLSDSTARNRWSWQSQLRGQGPDESDEHPGGGHDLHRLISPKGPFVAGESDGIPEIRVCLARNSAILSMGAVADDAAALAVQIRQGITSADLAATAGEFTLHASRMAWPTLSPDLTDSEASAIEAAFSELAESGEPRVWPIGEGIDIDGPPGAADVVGIVAARVVRVGPRHEGSAACLVIQPCMMSLPSGVTDATGRREGRVFLPNPYVAKIRLVD